MARGQVTGVTEWRRLLRRTEDALDDWRAVNRDVADMLAASARRAAPARTGALAASVKPSTTKYAAVVSAGSARVPYAQPIHWGWPRRGIRPNPFITNTIAERMGDVRGMYETAVEKIADRARRGP